MNQKCCMFYDQAVAVESADLCSKHPDGSVSEETGAITPLSIV
jgi:hypothetical protein